ncbi:MAG: hypothetical protein WBD13_13275 [Burkholderiaceae bacterium]
MTHPRYPIHDPKKPLSPFHLLTALILCLLSLTATSSRATAHPLDGLTPAEITQVGEILRTAGVASEQSRYGLIELLEPAKSDVLNWTKDKPLPRMATVHLREHGKVSKIVVDLSHDKVVSSEPLAGQPMVLLEEFIGSMQLALGSADFQAALAKRNITADDVFCLPLTAGSYPGNASAGKRIMKVPCYLNPTGSNFYAKPIEGLFAVVDLESKTVLEVVDEAVVPVATDPWGYTDVELEKRFGKLRPAMNAAQLSQKGGANFTIDGSLVSWDIWRFRYRTDKRPGVVLSDIQVQSPEKSPQKWRSVLYQAHLSEVFVPYMDPGEAWYWRTYMDSGEYGFGIFMSPLRAGIDCPRYATFLPAVVHQDNGTPLEIPDAICIFERNIGDPAWRHFEVFAQSENSFTPTEGRPATELVFRSASEVGNYDYLIDYVFHQNGRIDIMVGSTGLDAVKGVASQSMNDASAQADTQYGTLIAPNLVAPNHDHFFNFRLDFDIDGTANTFVRARLVAGKPADNALRRSFWVVEKQAVNYELNGRFRINPATPAMYHVMNANTESALGHHPGYMINPHNSFAYGPSDVRNDPPMRRNAYIDYSIWNTAFDPAQRYAGGELAFASSGEDSLPQWVKANRPINNKDIVTWYTMGFHHVPRMEDWPVMSTMWKGIQLVPFNFFANNPAATIRTPRTPPMPVSPAKN